MRLLHCADLHLGLRQYARLTPRGLNQREADIGDTFTRLITAAIAARPDVIVIAGDLFHSARPSNQAVTLAFTEFSRLIAALPDTPIAVSAGNHDLGKTADVGTILDLFRGLGLHVATYAAQRFTFPSLELSVLAVPDIHGVNRPSLAPDASARFNVLVLHGEVAGVAQGGADRRANTLEVSRDELGVGWDYVALGHYHQYERLSDRVAYAGSPDYCSSNPWQEITTPKGFVLHDLATGEHTFHPIAPARPFVDLAPIIAQGMTAADVDAAIAERVGSVEITKAVVRLVIDGIDRLTEKALDQKALRAISLRALHFRLDCRRTVAAIDTIREVTTQRKKEIESLVSRVERQLRSRELPADVDRDALSALALDYMRQADDATETIAPELPATPALPERETSIERQLRASLDQNTLNQNTLKRSA